MPRIEIVCLANSRKHSLRCVAGIRTDGRGWVRPVSAKPDGALSEAQVTLNTGQPIGALDIVEIEVLRAVPQPHQPENWLIADTTWTQTGTCEVRRMEALLPGNGRHEGPLLGSSGDRVLRSDLDEHPVPRSLDAIIPSEVTWVRTRDWNGKPQVRARFEWHDAPYDLVVTDPLWKSMFTGLAEGEYRADQIGLSPEDRILLTISLGEPMTTGCCFKLVAGVLVLNSAANSGHPGVGL